MADQPDAFPEFSDPRRASLISQAWDLLATSPVISIPPDTYALLWLCHIDNLAKIVHDLRVAEVSEEAKIKAGKLRDLLEAPTYFRDNVIKPYLSKCRGKDKLATSTTNTPTTTTPRHKRRRLNNDSSPLGSEQRPSLEIETDVQIAISRNQDIVKNAHRRDKCCVITEVPNPCLLEVAHIYPFMMSSLVSDNRQRFWEHLKVFWPADEVAEWERQVSGGARSEILENVLTLNILVHKAWDHCLFALKPIKLERDGMSLEAQFHWLAQNAKVSDFEVSNTEAKNAFLTQPNTAAGSVHGPRGLKLINNTTAAVIHSGHTITMTTNVPEFLPLPSFKLLNLQWHLSRLVAIVGGADVFMDEGSDDDDDDDGKDDWGLPASSIPSSVSKLFSSSQAVESSTSGDNGDDDGGKNAGRAPTSSPTYI